MVIYLRPLPPSLGLLVQHCLYWQRMTRLQATRLSLNNCFWDPESDIKITLYI